MSDDIRAHASRAVPGDPVAIGHGSLLFLGGLWPVIHLRSFEAITGRKDEGWLVKATGLLLASIGGFQLAHRRQPPRDVAALSLTVAASLIAIDVVYVAKRRIPFIYLADAAANAVCAVGWMKRLAAFDDTTDARDEGDTAPERTPYPVLRSSPWRRNAPLSRA